MPYKYAKERSDYSDFTSGRVFYSLPGYPAFPIRLASEIFQRCLAQRETIYEASTPCTLYDPCCGGAYHLSVLAYLHGKHIGEIIASDIDENAVALAKRNLSLLEREGLDKRIEELSRMFEQYGKDSHKDALRSAGILKRKLSALLESHTLETKVFQASATDSRGIEKHIEPQSVDLVLTDVPYGRHSQWHDSGLDPLRQMLEALLGILSPSSVVAIIADKQQKASHEKYQRLEQFQIGKRRVVILKPKG
jgi:tRNA G10  N-methylase Trm11